MSRISRNQFSALLLITDAFALFCLMGNISLITVAGFAAGTALQFIMAFPIIRFYSCGGGFGSKWVQIIYFVYLILWGGLLFAMQWDVSQFIYIPYSEGFRGKLLISGLIAVVCLYISSTGIKTLSRAAVIAAAIGAVCLFIVAVSSLFHAEWENFSRAESAAGISEEMMKGFVLSGGLGSFVVLLSMTKGKPMKNAAIYFLEKLILTVVITVTAIIVAGGIMEAADFPIVTAAQLSQPFPVQRIDSLFLMIFAIFAVFSIAVQTVTSAYLLGEIFPSFRKLRSTASLVLMIGAAFALHGTGRYIRIYSFALAAALLVVPSIMLIQKKIIKGR